MTWTRRNGFLAVLPGATFLVPPQGPTSLRWWTSPVHAQVWRLDTVLVLRLTTNRRLWLWLWLAMIGTALRVESAGHWPVPTSYSSRHWGEVEGLPSDIAHGVFPARDGFLWFLMSDGVVRFDGVTFEHFGPHNTPALAAGSVQSVAEDRRGGLWFGTAGGGLCHWDQGWRHLGRAEGLTNEQVKVVCVDARDRVWAGTDGGGLFRWDGAQFSFFGPASGLPSRNCETGAMDDADRLVLGLANRGAWLQDGERFRPLPGWPENEEIGAIYRDAQGGVWLTSGHQVWVWQRGELFPWKGAQPWGRERLHAVWSEPGRGLWVATGETVWRVDESGGEHFAATRHLSGFASLGIASDRDGCFWAVSENGGVLQLSPTPWVTAGVEAGLPTADVKTVAAGPDGSLWVGSAAGLTQLSPDRNGATGRMRHLAPPRDLVDPFVITLLPRADGSVWWASRNRGLWRLAGTNWSPVAREPAAGRELCWCLLARREGGVWAGTTQGVVHYDDAGTIVARYRGAQGLAHDDVRSLEEGSSGDLWIGTSSGLSRLRAGVVDPPIREAAGRPLNVVTALAAAGDDGLWVGTADQGLGYLRAGQFTWFTRTNGLPEDSVMSLLLDAAGNLWMGGARGLFRVDRSIWEAAVSGTNRAGASSRLSGRHYGKTDGLRTLECNGMIQPTAARTPDGRLWFAMAKGLAHHLPVADPPRPGPPVLQWTRLDFEGAPSGTKTLGLFGAEWRPFERLPAVVGSRDPKQPSWRSEWPTAVDLPSRDYQLRAEYSAPAFLAPSLLEFRQRLTSWDPDWVMVGSRRSAFSSRIAPGSYTLEVCVRQGPDGRWSEPLKLGLRVRPAWWQTWGARAGLGFCGAALALLGWWSRLRAVRRWYDLRLRLAADLHDELGADLASIQLQAGMLGEEPDLPPSIRRRVATLQRLARDAGQAVRDVVWFAAPSGDTSSDLCRRLEDTARNLLEEHSWQLVSTPPIRGPRLLSLDFRKNTFLAFKEAIANVVRHSGSRRVEIRVIETPTTFSFEVADQGCGFDTTLKPEGQGLRNLANRAAALGGSCVIDSRPDAGTVVRWTVPW